MKKREYSVEKEKEAEEKLYQFIKHELAEYAVPEILTGFVIAIFRIGQDIADEKVSNKEMGE